MKAAGVTIRRVEREQLHPLLSDERIIALWRKLDAGPRVEFLLDLWRTSQIAAEENDFSPLVKFVADWEATAEILADETLLQELEAERKAQGDSKGHSWAEMRNSLAIE